jgi:cytochrome P450
LADADVSGHAISKGEMIVVCIGAANRDPDQFEAPDRVDVTRTPNRHIAFSAGPHFCVGATLARLEAQIALNSLLGRMPAIALNAEPDWRDTITLRGLKALAVEF